MYFEWVEILLALLGGALIAAATSLHLYATGRITGMSSIFYTLATLNSKEGLLWKVVFAVGMAIPAYVLYLAAGEDGKIGDVALYHPYYYSIWALLIGGFLVGLGTKFGNGCTSGHAICGIPRLAKRSIMATFLFVMCGLSAGTLFTQMEWLRKVDVTSDWGEYYEEDLFRILTYVLFGVSVALGTVYAAVQLCSPEKSGMLNEVIVAAICGLLFGSGLAVSGMLNPRKILAFISIDPDTWDPSLIFVMLSAIGINLITFNYILKNLKVPVVCCDFPKPKVEFDVPVIIGPMVFGLGWGFSGLCPGPGMLNLFLLPQGFLYLISCAGGMLVATKLLLPLFEPEKKAEVTPLSLQSP